MSGTSAAIDAALWGRSPAVRQLRCAVRKVASFPTAVLLTGETGTGKSTVARALHRASPRRREPFVHVDCAGLADGLLEAELYGAAAGAFTGATRPRAGRLGAAGRGTLFLDEIGELSRTGQLKLLRVLEEAAYERLGETRTRRFEARVVAATHVDLERAVEEGAFRADLYYRLRVLELSVPPLRARREDLAGWLETARRRAADRLGRVPPVFSAEARERLVAHDWPGNLRELFHVVEAATVLADEMRVERDLIEDLLPPARRGVPHRGVSSQPTAETMDRQRLEVERAAGNLSLAARRLGIPRSTLRYRLGRDDALGRVRRRRSARSTPAESPRP